MFELKSVLYFVFVFLLPEIKFVGFWGLFGTWDACYTSRLCHCFFVNRYVLHAQNSQLFSGGKPFSVYLDFLRLCHCSELFVYNFVPDHCNTEAQKWSYQKKKIRNWFWNYEILRISSVVTIRGYWLTRAAIDDANVLGKTFGSRSLRTSSAHIAWKRCFPSVKSTTKLGCKLYPKTERKLDLEEIFAFDRQSCCTVICPRCAFCKLSCLTQRKHICIMWELTLTLNQMI